MIHSGNVVLVYNPLTGHTTPQFHVVFDDHFQTVAPNLSLSTSAEIDQLFETLWKDSQWQYDGDIPPEYLFLETLDFPDNKDNPQDPSPTFQDDQLAPDSLVDLLLQPMCPREPHKPLAHQHNTASTAPKRTHTSQQTDQEHHPQLPTQQTTSPGDPSDPLVNPTAPTIHGETLAAPPRAHTQTNGGPLEPPTTQNTNQHEETHMAPLLFTLETEPTVTKRLLPDTAYSPTNSPANVITQSPKWQ